MSKSLPTVAVNRGGHLAIINESDFNPDTDTFWSEPDAKEQSIRLRGQDEIETPQTQETEVAIALKSIESRLSDLQALADAGKWRELKAISEGYGIARPNDGWDAAVLPILVAEYGQSAAEEVFTSPEVIDGNP